MKLTSKSRYAMRAMVFLAESGENAPMPLNKIARCGMPENYLEQLLGTLRRRGLVKSVRGNQGGYLLAKPACDITLGDIITAVDGPIKKSLCFSDKAKCDGLAGCGVSKTWDLVTDGIEQVVNRFSLSDMLGQSPNLSILEDR